MTSAKTARAVVRLAPACVGILLAGVLAPRAVLAGAPTGGGGYSAPAASFSSAPSQPGDATSPYSGLDPIPNPGSDSGCLPASALSGVMASDDHHAILRFGRTAFYQLRMNKACPALLAAGAHVVGVTRDSAMICEPDDVELKIASRDGAVSRCPIYDMNRIRVAEAAATSAHH